MGASPTNTAVGERDAAAASKSLVVKAKVASAGPSSSPVAAVRKRNTRVSEEAVRPLAEVALP